jgi:glucose-6-phosphate isomerase
MLRRWASLTDAALFVCPVERQVHDNKAGKMQDREKARAKLHPSLRDTFDRLLEEYEVSAKIHTGEVSVNYDIIADLVRAGWRRVLP